MGDKYAKVSDIKAVFIKALPQFDKDMLEKVYIIMDPLYTGLVDEKTYRDVMKIWSCFSAVDVNDDNELDADELKTLIWVVEGKEPDPRRIKKLLLLIDSDGGGTIDRAEFMEYMMNPSGDIKYQNLEVKKYFDKYDIDGNGTIEIDEFRIIMINTFKTILAEKTETGKAEAIELIAVLANELFRELDKDGGGAIDWEEFKVFAAISSEKIDSIK